MTTIVIKLGNDTDFKMTVPDHLTKLEARWFLMGNIHLLILTSQHLMGSPMGGGICRGVNHDKTRVRRGISEMSWRHHQDPGWGVFGFNVMFRPPLGILPRFFTNFQVPDVLHRGGGAYDPHRRSDGLEPMLRYLRYFIIFKDR